MNTPASALEHYHGPTMFHGIPLIVSDSIVGGNLNPADFHAAASADCGKVIVHERCEMPSAVDILLKITLDKAREGGRDTWPTALLVTHRTLLQYEKLVIEQQQAVDRARATQRENGWSASPLKPVEPKIVTAGSVIEYRPDATAYVMRPYRLKQPAVEAAQYLPWQPRIPDVVCFCNKQQNRLAHVHRGAIAHNMLLPVAGDWIIKTSDGVYELRSDVSFKKSYEPA